MLFRSGRFVGEDVLAWCDPERLDLIAITSLDRKRGPFFVPRLEPIPAIDASSEQLNRNADQIESHNDYARTAYRTISPHLVSHSFRRVLADAATLATGERFKAEAQNAVEGQDRQRNNVSKIRKLSRQLKIRPSTLTDPATIASVAEGYDLMAEAHQLRSEEKERCL